MRRKYKRLKISIIGIFVSLLLGAFGSYYKPFSNMLNNNFTQNESLKNIQEVEVIPNFDGENYVVSINGNCPTFTEEDLIVRSNGWQRFADLDSHNRVGTAEAMLHKSMMPTEGRGDIQNVYPTGWQQKKIDGKWLYNRSHLVGHQLTGENDNWKNLFTGTEQMNQDEMVEYENKVADYLRSTDNYVRYRITPRFHEDELCC